MIEWEVVGATTEAGAASTTKQAWAAAARAALEVATKSGGEPPVTLTVAGAAAILYPALDEHGRHDPVATAAAAQLLLDDLDNEAAQSGTPRPDRHDSTR